MASVEVLEDEAFGVEVVEGVGGLEEEVMALGFCPIGMGIGM